MFIDINPTGPHASTLVKPLALYCSKDTWKVMGDEDLTNDGRPMTTVISGFFTQKHI
jgi:hypothetical protein